MPVRMRRRLRRCVCCRLCCVQSMLRWLRRELSRTLLVQLVLLQQLLLLLRHRRCRRMLLLHLHRLQLSLSRTAVK